LKDGWCIPPKANAAFVCQMEDVLDVYKRPHDPNCPQLCLDEMPKQLLAETYEPLPIKPGRVQKQDYEYERHGTAVRNGLTRLHANTIAVCICAS